MCVFRPRQFESKQALVQSRISCYTFQWQNPSRDCRRTDEIAGENGACDSYGRNLRGELEAPAKFFCLNRS